MGRLPMGFSEKFTENTVEVLLFLTAFRVSI